jgi:hypothetical protein
MVLSQPLIVRVCRDYLESSLTKQCRMFGRHAGILPHNISSLVLELAIFYQIFAAFFLRNRYIISCTRTRHGVPSVLSAIRMTSRQKSLQGRNTFFGR